MIAFRKSYNPRKKPRHLVLGDQLDPQSSAFDGFDAKQDAVWMAEVKQESTHVWSHQVRITLFLSAMCHFRDSLVDSGLLVCPLPDPQPDLQRTRPKSRRGCNSRFIEVIFEPLASIQNARRLIHG